MAACALRDVLITKRKEKVNCYLALELNVCNISAPSILRPADARCGLAGVMMRKLRENAWAGGWGLAEIDAKVVSLGELERQIAECDENLAGPKLSPSEKALFTRRRQEAYEALHGKAKAIGGGMHRQPPKVRT